VDLGEHIDDRGVMNQELTLYTYFRSSTSYRVRIALHLKGLKFTSKPIHLLEGGGQQHTPEYRSINPAGEVPSLIHNGNTLGQSFAIIEYLEDLVPEPRLFPTTPYDKAKVRQICEHINCGIHPIANLKVQQYLTKEFQLSEEQKTQWIQHWIKQGMDALELLISKTAGEFAYGDSLTAADLFIAPQVFSSKRFGIGLDNYKTIQKVYEKSMKIDAFNKAHPHVQPDTPPELFGKV